MEYSLRSCSKWNNSDVNQFYYSYDKRNNTNTWKWRNEILQHPDKKSNWNRGYISIFPFKDPIIKEK